MDYAHFFATELCWIKLSLIVQYSWLLPLKEDGPYFNPAVVDAPTKRPTK